MANPRRATIVLFVAALTILCIPAALAAEYATGVVFNDQNRNGIRDAGERGIPDVRVSNGRTSVRTDRDGLYRIPVGDDTIIFVVKPAGWMTAVDENGIPRFYYIHKPAGSPPLKYKGVDPTGPLPESVDFPLYPREEPERFDVVVFGDTQPYDKRQVLYLGHDIIAEVAGIDAAFGVTLGDVVGDTLSLYEPLVPLMGRVGIPWYHVKGNHDSNYDAQPNHDLVDETFERVFGPSYYSFDYGPVHFVVLNNPNFARPSGYHAELDLRQMSFLRHDLAATPKDQLVVIMMHIPINEMSDRGEIYRMLESRPHTLSISAHTHTNEHRFIGREDGWNGPEPHHHWVSGTTCGSWWSGALDEVGIPHSTMSDGTPNGYTIATFDGNSYSLRYKVARRPADYQMNIFAPNEVSSADAGKTEVYTNIFNGSVRSTVEMRLGDKGEWIPMQMTLEEDPTFVQTTKAEETGGIPAGSQKLAGWSKCRHLWKANLSERPDPGVYFIHIRTTDMFGHEFTGRRVIHVN